MKQLLVNHFSFKIQKFDIFPVVMICGAILLPSLNFQYSLVPIFCCFLFIIYTFLYRVSYSKSELVLLFLIFLNLIFTILISSSNHLKEILCLILILGSIFYLKKAKVAQLSKALDFSLNLILLASIIQVLTPSLWSIISSLLTRSIDITSQGARGVTALSTEPSFMALQLLAILLGKHYLYDLRKSDIIKIILLSASTLSLFGILVIILTILSTPKDSRRFIMIFSLVLFTILIFLIEGLTGFRSFSVALNIYNNGLSVLLEDVSISSRYFYIYKDFFASYKNFFIPVGPGNYYYISQEINLDKLHLLWHTYDSKMAGSYIGYWLYEYSFLILVPIYITLSFWFKILLKSTNSFLSSLFSIFLLVIVYLQMISLVYSPFAFLIAFPFIKKKINND